MACCLWLWTVTPSSQTGREASSTACLPASLCARLGIGAGGARLSPLRSQGASLLPPPLCSVVFLHTPLSPFPTSHPLSLHTTPTWWAPPSDA